MNQFKASDYIDVRQAAERLAYTQANITRIIRNGQLPALKRGRKYFIKPEDLDRYAFGGQTEQFLT
jgi:excisionase family DNA binding protein